jgi:hypothetical protein
MINLSLSLFTNVTFSNDTGKGLYSELDSALAFLPMQYFLDATDIADLVSLIVQEENLTIAGSLQELQNPIQKQWLEQGDVAQVTFALLSRGVISPVANKSYINMLSGLMVCPLVSVYPSMPHSSQHPTSRGSVVSEPVLYMPPD